jgi:uncharacterized protein (DUF58 family)
MGIEVLRFRESRSTPSSSSRALRRLRFFAHPLVVLTVIGVVAAVVGLTLDSRAWPPAIVCGAAIAVGLAWPRISLWSLEARLILPSERVIEGEPLELHLQISNTAPWKVPGLVYEQEAIGHSTSEPSIGVALAPVVGLGTETFVWTTSTARRGRFPRRVPHLATGFPFGLERRRKEISAADSILVLPRSFPIVGLPKPRCSPAYDGLNEAALAGNSGSTLGLRTYRRGDARRDIHWRQTARVGTLIVREREAFDVTRIRIVVDASRTACGSGEPEVVLDWITRFAASLQSRSRELGAVVCVGVSASRYVEFYEGQAALDALAELELGESSTSTTLERVRRDQADRGETWFITTPLGFSRLSPQEQATNGWSFFIIEASGSSARLGLPLNGTTSPVYSCSLPADRFMQSSTEEGAFRVQQLG